MANEMVTGLTPLRQEPAPLRNQIIATLRGAIETGMLRPGARLIERDLCEQLNVSRTSLREALRELQAFGVLSSTENRGLVVRTLSPEEARNIYSIRAVLEALVTGQFVELASNADVDQLVTLGGALKEAYASGSVERIIKAKRSFYDCICTGAQNDTAFEIINRLTLRTSSLRSRSLARAERQQQSIREIDAILAAVRARDSDVAKVAAATHVENAAQSALAEETATQEEAPRDSARRKRG